MMLLGGDVTVVFHGVVWGLSLGFTVGLGFTVTGGLRTVGWVFEWRKGAFD